MRSFTIVAMLSALLGVSAFTHRTPLRRHSKLSMSYEQGMQQFIPNMGSFNLGSFLLSDTSISEEEVLAVTGQADNLPSPFYAVLLAIGIFAGVGILQFSLGDLTKQEGQARVRDFLQTRRETERKRGYFD